MRANPNEPFPEMSHEITIVSNTTNVHLSSATADILQSTGNGAPFKLEFEKLILRPPVAPEHDLSFSERELSDWRPYVWEPQET